MRPTAKWDAFQIAHMQLYKYYSFSQRIRREKAAAAAKAAAEMLLSGEEIRQVRLLTPKGIELLSLIHI